MQSKLYSKLSNLTVILLGNLASAVRSHTLDKPLLSGNRAVLSSLQPDEPVKQVTMLLL
jgi:hypothetical protein